MWQQTTKILLLSIRLPWIQRLWRFSYASELAGNASRVSAPLIASLFARVHLAALPLRAATEHMIGWVLGLRYGLPLTAPPFPRPHTLRFREAPKAKPILTGMSLVIEECVVVEISSIDPGVTFANHFSIDVPVTDPDVTYCATVAVGVDHAHLDIFSEHFAR